MSVIFRDYQIKAIEKCVPHKGCGLDATMGSGKTLMSLEIARRHNPDKVVVVCPSMSGKLPKQWAYEAPHAEVYTYEGIQRANVVMTEDSVLIMDESQYLKNPAAKRTKHIIQLVRKFKPYTILLTGTPITIDQGDYLTQLYLSYNRCGCKSLKQMRNTYYPYLPTVDPVKQNLGIWCERQPANQEVLAKHIARNWCTIGKEEVGFISKQHPMRIIKIPLTGKQRTLIKQLLEEGAKRIDDKTYIKNTLHGIYGILAGFISQRDIISGEVTETHYIKTNKHKAILRYIEKLKGKQAIIFSRYRHGVKVISRLLTSANIPHDTILGGQKTDTSGFDSETKQILVASVAAASTGIDYPDVDYTLYYDTPPSYVHYQQSKSRIHRLTSTRDKHYHILLSEKFEHKLYKSILKRKSEINQFQQLLDD